MIPYLPGLLRFSSDQKTEIRAAQELREQAKSLRERVSGGTYDDSDLVLFWKLTAKAGVVLRTSNPQLGERTRLGNNFFSSVSREQRRPQLTNFLRALSTIVDVANERLLDVENTIKPVEK